MPAIVQSHRLVQPVVNIAGLTDRWRTSVDENVVAAIQLADVSRTPYKRDGIHWFGFAAVAAAINELSGVLIMGNGNNAQDWKLEINRCWVQNNTAGTANFRLIFMDPSELAVTTQISNDFVRRSDARFGSTDAQLTPGVISGRRMASTGALLPPTQLTYIQTLPVVGQFTELREIRLDPPVVLWNRSKSGLPPGFGWFCTTPNNAIAAGFSGKFWNHPETETSLEE